MIKIMIIFLIIISGCSTPYKSNGPMGGFSETQIDKDKFIVNYRGNGFTSAEHVTDMAILRCAELALNNGYYYFMIVEYDKDSKEYYYTTPSTTNNSINLYGQTNSKLQTNIFGQTYGTSNTKVRGTGTSTTYHGTTHNIKKHRNSLIIVLLSDSEPGALNSTYVFNSIKSKYGLNLITPLIKPSGNFDENGYFILTH